MTLEEGLQRAVQEWQHTSNFAWIIYYEMAAKFKEFEIKEERQIQLFEVRKGSQCPPLSSPPKLHSQVPLGTVEGQQPVSIPKKSGPKAEISSQRQRRHQRTLKIKVPKEIPPEAVKEYMDIMDGLMGPLHSASEGEDGKWEEEEHDEQQEDDGMYVDLDLFSYIDQLSAEEDFVTKVEAVIHPRFLAELLSPGAHIDFLSLTEELQQEEGLTPTQLVEQHLISLKEVEVVDAPPSDDVPGLGSIASTCRSSNGAENRDDHGQVLVVKISTDGRENNSLALPKDIAVSIRSQETPKIIKKQTSPNQDQRHSSPRIGSKDEMALQETSPISAASRHADGCSEEEDEELSTLAFLLASQHHLLPWGLFQSPLPGSGCHTSGVTGAWGISLLILSMKRGHNQTPHPAAKSPNSDLVEGPSSAANTPLLRADFGASGRQPLALGASQSSQPQKRKCSPLSGHRKKKPHCRD